MATTSTTHLRPKLLSLYRSLLRELPPQSLSNPSPLKQRLRNRFVDKISLSASPSSSTASSTSIPTTSSSSPSSSSSVATEELAVLEEKILTTEQFVAYARAQRTYVTLLERYNPGMDMDEQERVRLTARRVGMDLPIEKDSDKNEGGDNGGDKGSLGSG